jgi:hypothetical protein
MMHSLEEHGKLSFIAFGGRQAKAGLLPGWASYRLTPHPKGRRFCGISFSLSKRAELAPSDSVAAYRVSEPRALASGFEASRGKRHIVVN